MKIDTTKNIELQLFCVFVVLLQTQIDISNYINFYCDEFYDKYFEMCQYYDICKDIKWIGSFQNLF